MKIIKLNTLEFVPAGHEDKDNPGVIKKVLFNRDDLVNGRVQMINWAKLPPGKSFRRHYHEDMEEVFVMIEGEARIRVDEEEAVISRGDSVLVPARSTHKMFNDTSSDVIYLVVGITQDKGGKTIVVE